MLHIGERINTTIYRQDAHKQIRGSYVAKITVSTFEQFHKIEQPV